MTGNNETAPPDVLLLMGKRCPYCPTVLKGLQALETSGEIGWLETAVMEDNPELAAELGVRSVPWVRIGPFELPGLRSEQELREWAQKAGSPAGMASYLDELLSTGGIKKALELVRNEPLAMDAILALFEDTDTKLNTRIGISAVMEELQGCKQLQGIVGKLGELTRHDEASIRGDACHFLALSDSDSAIEYIRPLLDDPDASVREIAEESLAELEPAG